MERVVRIARVRHGRIASIARQLCPGCREGRVFAKAFRMNERCPVCELRFEREPGYFVAAMYISYALSVPLLVLLTLGVGELLPGWPLEAVLISAAVLALPLVPLVFRYSRVLWLHLDRTIDRSS